MNKPSEVVEVAETPAHLHIPTRFMVFSDTHEMDSVFDCFSRNYADVILHCGDFTNQSKLSEFKSAIQIPSGHERLPQAHDSRKSRVQYGSTSILMEGGRSNVPLRSPPC